MHTIYSEKQDTQGGESLENRAAAFTQLAIQLAARLATADGAASESKYAYWAMREVLPVSAQDDVKLRRLWLRAMDDMQPLAETLRTLHRQFPRASQLHAALLERLCVVARADGRVSKRKMHLLRRVGRGLRLSLWRREMIIRRYCRGEDPYAVLGVDPKLALSQLRKQYRAMVRALHPDYYIAYGASAETIAYMTARLASVNAAYASIAAGRDWERVAAVKA